MALLPDNVSTNQSDEDIAARFQATWPATDAQVAYRNDISVAFTALAQTLNRDIADSREKSLALTALEQAFDWSERAIFTRG
jgi:hypothetical protein